MSPAELNDFLKKEKNKETRYIKEQRKGIQEAQSQVIPTKSQENKESDSIFVQAEASSSVTSSNSAEAEILKFFRYAGFFENRVDRQSLVESIDGFVDFEAAYWLVDEFKKYIEVKQDQDAPFSEIKFLLTNQEVLNEHLDYIVDRFYNFYSHSESKPKFIKSIHVFHDNDVFMFSKKNADRDYTGGFRFELTTDLLKMRLFRSALNGDHVLSYQSLLVGGEGYTPYVRFDEDELRNVYGLKLMRQAGDLFYNDSDLALIQNFMTSNQERSDRPFASFQYIGRGKYRLHNFGHLRSKSFTKIGKVGGEVGKNIQAIIHQDLSVGSQRVLNWERQIAQGGRLAINTETQLDLMVLSQKATLRRHSGYSSTNDANHNIPSWVNVYTPVEWALGTVHTYIGTGIGFSTKSFTELSGLNDLKLRIDQSSPLFNRVLNSLVINMEWKNRYIVHNSMLEGLGFFKPFKDDPLDDEALTVYTLKDKDINRWTSTVDFSLSLRLRKMTVNYSQQRFLRKEFEVKNLSGLGSSTLDPNFTSPSFYGFGRFALNFIL
jgi:hypothetical protein